MEPDESNAGAGNFVRTASARSRGVRKWCSLALLLFAQVAARWCGSSSAVITVIKQTHAISSADFVIALRFLTGICMAGVYPVGLRLAASWASGDLGLLIGLLAGTLTIGSASPHLLAALGGAD
jgi:MFS family permease